MMHTSIARGDVWCKNWSFSALPQSARPATEEEDEEAEGDDEKIGKSRAISLKDIA